MALVAGVVSLLVATPVASADPAGIAHRGLEATLMAGGKTVPDPVAPDGEALNLRAGMVATTWLDTVPARGVVVTASASCRHAVIQLNPDLA